MPTVTLLGRIYPECYNFAFSHNTLSWNWEKEELNFRFDVKIQNSAVVVECAIERFEPDFVSEIYKRARDLTLSAINLFAFTSGIGFQPIFTHFIDPDGNESILALQEPRLAEFCTSISNLNVDGKLSFDEAWTYVISNPAMFQILSDLISTITIPHQSTIVCARSIEGLRNLIATPGTSVVQSWEKMRQALRVDRRYLQLITEVSTAPRHGDHRFIAGDIATEVTARTWKLMDRFFHYVRLGKIPLPEDQFPTLVG